MHEVTRDKDAVKSLMETTIRYLERKRTKSKKGGTKAMSVSSKAKKPATSKDPVAVWQKGLSRLKKKPSGATAASLKKSPPVGERGIPSGYAPRDQIIALFQSAMDEYLNEEVGPSSSMSAPKAAKGGTMGASLGKKKKAKSVATVDSFFTSGKEPTKPGTIAKASDIFAQFGNLDPRWIEVAIEKAKVWFKKKHPFTKHQSTSDFRFKMENETTVAIVGDWGGGNAAAQAVAKQIAAIKPNHIIHLGDVYYAGTPKEVEERFLKYWPTPKQPGHSFALNSNHEMYSGGYGYFDLTLKTFQQPASYFSLANDNWRFLGLDTGYDEHELKDPQADWVKTQLKETGPRTILLTHHQLFSAYEKTKADKLRAKVQPFLSQVYGWFWGHEHLAVVYEKKDGIQAVCLGNGCFPYGFPKSAPAVPVKWLDKHKGDDSDYPGGHTFALLKIKGPRIDIDFIDHTGKVGNSETWQ
jgi:predicted phosphodiesterase